MAASISFQATQTNANNIGDNATHTFNLTVAAASGQERLVALAGIGTPAASASYDAVTVDGQTATQVGAVSRGADDGAGFCCYVTFWRAPGTASTAVAVVATANCPGGNLESGYCAVWSLNDADTLLASTTAAVNDPNLNTNTVTDGVAASSLLGYTAVSPLVAWTGLTEVFDGVRVFGDEVFSGASANIASGSTPLTISANITPDLAGSIASMAVSFNPDASSDTLRPQGVM